MKRKTFSFVLIMLMSMTANISMAYDVEIDGIYYNLSGDEASVTRKGNLDYYSGIITIPEYIIYSNKTYVVTSIGYMAFYYCQDLTSINIPNSVNTIGSYAFGWCENLASITLPESVISIEDGALSGCGKLSSITIPKSVVSIGSFAFAGCEELSSIQVDPDNIEYDSRNGCNAIIETSTNTLISGCNNTIIPESVTNINEGAFYGSGLSSITIPKSVVNIGHQALNDCGNLSSIQVEIGNTVYDSRNNCNALIQTRDNRLVVGCMNTMIPDDITIIENDAFQGCIGLTSIFIPNSVTTIGNGTFSGCIGLTSINIPDKVRRIGMNTFSGCKSLTHINVPNSVTTISEYSFRDCSGLTNISIPSSITKLDQYAFLDCTSLSTIIVGMETPINLFATTFNKETYGSATLYVPKGSRAAYQNADVWKEFKEIKEFNCLYADDLPITAGGVNAIGLNFTNENISLVGFQMDIMLPQGVGIDKTGCSLSSRITDENQELTIGKLENGDYRITSTSLSLTPISGNDGTLLTLKLTAEDGCIGGQATISNIRFSTSESEKIIMDDETFDISVLYNLTYKVDGEEFMTSSIAYGTTLTPESNPTKEGHTFSGWSELPSTMPNHDVIITGTFSVNSYNLTYIVDGEEYKTFSVVYGTVVMPEEPTKEGYTFSGWSELPKTMPARDVVVTGTFTLNSYKLTYMVDGGEYKELSVEYGTTITPEAEPTKDGYTFGGWSELPETMPAHDVVITGRFYLYGDVNTDEEVDVVDVVDVARFVVATPSAKFREKLADLNYDKTVNIADAVVLVNHIAGDQNFVKAMNPLGLSYNYDQCKLQLLSAEKNALSLCLDGETDFTALQFDVDVPEGVDISAIRINGMRKDGHQLLYNKVGENHYRVTALSLSNATFKGNNGELLQFSINGEAMDDICIHDIHFVTANGKDLTYDALYVNGIVTGITDVNANSSNDVIYDLQGRKLSKVQRGVNIINGKKVIVNK